MNMPNTTEKPHLVEHALRNAKGSNRIQINNNLTAVSLVILSLLLATGKIVIGWFVIAQLAASIPFLATSSLAYSKMSYRDPGEYAYWDNFAWLTHTTGYLFLLNAFTLILYKSPFQIIAWVFLLVNIALHIIYSYINIRCNPERRESRKRKGLWKLCTYIAFILFGAVMPMVFGWA